MVQVTHVCCWGGCVVEWYHRYTVQARARNDIALPEGKLWGGTCRKTYRHTMQKYYWYLYEKSMTRHMHCQCITQFCPQGQKTGTCKHGCCHCRMMIQGIKSSSECQEESKKHDCKGVPTAYSLGAQKHTPQGGQCARPIWETTVCSSRHGTTQVDLLVRTPEGTKLSHTHRVDN